MRNKISQLKNNQSLVCMAFERSKFVKDRHIPGLYFGKISALQVITLIFYNLSEEDCFSKKFGIVHEAKISKSQNFLP